VKIVMPFVGGEDCDCWIVVLKKHNDKQPVFMALCFLRERHRCNTQWKNIKIEKNNTRDKIYIMTLLLNLRRNEVNNQLYVIEIFVFLLIIIFCK